ncbi:MAG: DUF4298 domain-containing protein [Clostridia bacterium]|nr:DUF4298 domain-containing protein [Clostridia bacterium]
MADQQNMECAVARITHMEEYMDTLINALRLGLALDTPEMQEKIRMLADYMDSGLWLQDYQRDERGELPPTLKRGVLSEDGLYNLLAEIKIPEA